VKIGRDLIGKAHAKDAQNRPHSYEALEKLADLQKRGIISEEEYTAKKKDILGLI